ncbi:MAG: serine/threonine protein kinase bacterial [Anaerolineaceae bacterium]|nr:MAG: serine/threonine protein kinase bacterial [Anaerolineaceae bacterium]
MSFTVGEMVGPYRIIEQLGQGGMATVYKAYHAALDRYVALKVLHPAFLEDPNFLARFQREARLVAKLDHPNIVPIFDYAEHEGRPYLVMKFIEGETLKARLARGSVAPEETLRIVEAVGVALSFAHKRGILHRDVKPSNVLLSGDGGIYLADFGLARIAQSGESTLTSDMILGTPQYISPEQALGKKDLDEGTDIYSFGVMLYELSVGKVPFSADTPFSIIHDHIYSPLPMPRQVNPTVSEAVERVLLKTLAKERADRHKDVHGMVDAFKHAWNESTPPVPVAEETIRAEMKTRGAPRTEVPPPPAGPVSTLKAEAPAPGPAPVPAVRKKISWMWIAVGALLLVCCVIGGLALRSLPRGQTTRTPQPADTRPPLPTSTPTELELARQKVESNPEDPYAHMDLVFAYLRVNQETQARDELENAISAGGANQQFFIDAGGRLAGAQSWLMSARMYLRAAELTGTGSPLPEEVSVAFHEAVYKAFILPEARDYIPYESIGNVDKPLQYIARARYSFYNVDQTQGWTGLADLDTYKANMFESGLLHGEFYARSNKAAEAKRALNTLLVRAGLPEWIRAEARNILDSLPK